MVFIKYQNQFLSKLYRLKQEEEDVKKTEVQLFNERRRLSMSKQTVQEIMETRLEVQMRARRDELNLVDEVKDLAFIGLVNPLDR